MSGALPYDDPDAAWFTIGQVADMLSVQIPFLRRLDAEGLVQPTRSAGGQRRYTRREINRIERVVRLVAEGLALEGIRRLVILEDQVADLQHRLGQAEATDG